MLKVLEVARKFLVHFTKGNLELKLLLTACYIWCGGFCVQKQISMISGDQYVFYDFLLLCVFYKCKETQSIFRNKLKV